MNLWSERLIGILLLGLVLTLGMAAASQWVSNRTGQYLATQVRMFDSVRPHMLLVVFLISGLLALLGESRAALVGLIGASTVLCFLVLDYRARSAPSAERGDLTVVWFNMLQSNKIAPESLALAIRDSGADVVAIGESRNAAILPKLLTEEYPYRVGCRELTQEHCGVMLLSRLPLKSVRLRDLPSGRERFIRLRLEVSGRGPVHMIVMHMVKPWFTGMAEVEQEALDAALEGARDVPLILMGDFNAAPWSRRNRQIERRHGMLHAARPVATWPAEAGGFGVPIDHVLLRGGARFVSIYPWGKGLGSNHRGLIATISLPSENTVIP